MSNKLNRIALEIEVEGRVQGVGFRNFTQKTALELGIFGWVKNQSNGSVLIKAEGTQMQLDQFLEWCYGGPPISRVDKINVEEIEISNFKNFLING